MTAPLIANCAPPCPPKQVCPAVVVPCPPATPQAVPIDGAGALIALIAIVALVGCFAILFADARRLEKQHRAEGRYPDANPTTETP